MRLGKQREGNAERNVLPVRRRCHPIHSQQPSTVEFRGFTLVELRAVFIDEGHTSPQDFIVHCLCPKWAWYSPPPIQHAGGTTLSMADGHAEYWKWKGRETVTGLPRELTFRGDSRFDELLVDHYEPQTDSGLYDLQRLQRATRGRLGYPTGEAD